MRRQCHLVKIKTGLLKGLFKKKEGIPVTMYTHVNKSDDPARLTRRNARKKA